MMFSRKTIRIGTSVGTTFPKEFLRACNIKPGSLLSLSYDERRKGIFVTSAKPEKKDSHHRIAQSALRFIKKYKADLRALKNK